MSKMGSLAADLAAVEVDGRVLQDICHNLAVQSGWWTDLRTGELFTMEERYAKLDTKLLLCHSELSEAFEAYRKGNRRDDHLPHRSGLEVELADAVIRIMDLAGALGLDLGAAMAQKLSYNQRREDHTLAHRRSAGGKSV